MADKPGVIEESKHAMNDNTHSIGEKAPGTPFALVALSYLLVLALGSFAIASLYWVLR